MWYVVVRVKCWVFMDNLSIVRVKCWVFMDNLSIVRVTTRSSVRAKYYVLNAMFIRHIVIVQYSISQVKYTHIYINTPLL